MKKEILFCNNCQKILDEENQCCKYCGYINLRYKGTFEERKYINTKINIFDRIKLSQSKISVILMIITNIITFILGYLLILNNELSLKYNVIAGILTTIIYFYFICFQFIFIKANYQWYKIFIPLYNIYLYFELCTKKGLLSLILIVPYLLYLYGNLTSNIFMLNLSFSLIIAIQFILMYLLANKFKINEIKFMLLSFIMIPLIAFCDNYVYN